MHMRAKQRFIVVFALMLLLCAATPALALDSLPDKGIDSAASEADILLLQGALIELGYLDRAHSDGTYNPETEAAVTQLQYMLGIAPSGRFDSETAQAYNAYASLTDEEPALPLEGYIIGIDPGHQKKADNRLEAIAPGSERTKERMTPGGVGVRTGVKEFEITLSVAKKLKKLLEDMGADVVMARGKHDVTLSNIDRAKLMNKSGVDFWVRIHCDASSDSEDSGAHIMVPSKSAAPEIHSESLELGKHLIKAFCAATQAKQNAVLVKSDQTGMNWSNSPVVTLEMGYLSNPDEDMLLTRGSYQNTCAKGILEGILSYCATNPKG